MIIRMRGQHPKSRHPAVHDTRSVGKTTMIAQPQHKRIKPTGAHIEERHEFFRGHALAGPSMRASMGGLGDADHGYTAHPATSGSGIHKTKRMAGFSFGSRSPHQDETISYRGTAMPSKIFPSKVPKGRTPAY